MPSQKNINQVKNIQEKLARAKSVVLANYQGLSVNQQEKLRQKIRQAEGEILVVKNTLLNLVLAAQKIELPADFKEILRGPTFVLFAYGDEITPIKSLADFAKINDLPTIKAGFLNREYLSAERTEQLGQLPTKIELTVKTITAIKSPLSGFVNVLFGNLKNLVYSLEAIKKNLKGGDKNGRK